MVCQNKDPLLFLGVGGGSLTARKAITHSWCSKMCIHTLILKDALRVHNIFIVPHEITREIKVSSSHKEVA